jgi:hypothetical protein
MNISFGRVLLAVALAAGIARSAPVEAATATTRINALVMAENASPETMSRAVPIHRRVVTQLSEALNQRGIQIYDADLLASQYMTPGKTRYTDDELLSLARTVATTTPIDVVVFFEVVADIQQNPVTPRVLYPRVRMPGRILNVRTAQLVGAFEVEAGRLPPLPVPCDQECVMSNVGDDAKLIASDLGDALVQKLAGWNAGGLDRATAGSAGALAPRLADGAPAPAPAPAAGPAPVGPTCEGLSGDFTIQIKDFRQDELLRIEEAIRMFSCYEEMRPMRSGATYADYSYRTSSGAQRLDRNLRRMLEFLDLTGQVRFDGTRFEVQKITTRQ